MPSAEIHTKEHAKLFLTTHLSNPHSLRDRRYYFLTTDPQNDTPEHKRKINAVINSWDQANLPYILVKVRHHARIHFHAVLYGKHNAIIFAPVKYFRAAYRCDEFNAYKLFGDTTKIGAVHEADKFKYEGARPVIYTFQQSEKHPGALVKYRFSESYKKLLTDK